MSTTGLTLSGTALDPGSSYVLPDFPAVGDSSSMDSATVASGGGGFFSGFGGLLTSISNTVGVALKSNTTAQPITVKPGSTLLGANGQIIQVPGGGLSTTTLIFIGLGLLAAFIIFRRMA